MERENLFNNLKNYSFYELSSFHEFLAPRFSFRRVVPAFPSFKNSFILDIAGLAECILSTKIIIKNSTKIIVFLIFVEEYGKVLCIFWFYPYLEDRGYKWLGKL